MKTEERKKDTKKLNLKIIITLCNLAISVGMMSECIKAITNSDPWGLSAAFGIVLMIPFIYLFIYSIIQIKNIFKKKIEITTIDTITSIYYTIFFISFILKML